MYTSYLSGNRIGQAYTSHLSGNRIKQAYATCYLSFEATKLLLKYGADINAKDNYGQTALTVLAFSEKATSKVVNLSNTNLHRSKITKLLVEYDAILNKYYPIQKENMRQLNIKN